MDYNYMEVMLTSNKFYKSLYNAKFNTYNVVSNKLYLEKYRYMLSEGKPHLATSLKKFLYETVDCTPVDSFDPHTHLAHIFRSVRLQQRLLKAEYPTSFKHYSDPTHQYTQVQNNRLYRNYAVGLKRYHTTDANSFLFEPQHNIELKREFLEEFRGVLELLAEDKRLEFVLEAQLPALLTKLDTIVNNLRLEYQDLQFYKLLVKKTYPSNKNSEGNFATVEFYRNPYVQWYVYLLNYSNKAHCFPKIKIYPEERDSIFKYVTNYVINNGIVTVVKGLDFDSYMFYMTFMGYMLAFALIAVLPNVAIYTWFAYNKWRSVNDKLKYMGSLVVVNLLIAVAFYIMKWTIKFIGNYIFDVNYLNSYVQSFGYRVSPYMRYVAYKLKYSDQISRTQAVRTFRDQLNYNAYFYYLTLNNVVGLYYVGKFGGALVFLCLIIYGWLNFGVDTAEYIFTRKGLMTRFLLGNQVAKYLGYEDIAVDPHSMRLVEHGASGKRAVLEQDSKVEENQRSMKSPDSDRLLGHLMDSWESAPGSILLTHGLSAYGTPGTMFDGINNVYMLIRLMLGKGRGYVVQGLFNYFYDDAEFDRFSHSAIYFALTKDKESAKSWYYHSFQDYRRLFYRDDKHSKVNKIELEQFIMRFYDFKMYVWYKTILKYGSVMLLGLLLLFFWYDVTIYYDYYMKSNNLDLTMIENKFEQI